MRFQAIEQKCGSGKNYHGKLMKPFELFASIYSIIKAEIIKNKVTYWNRLRRLLIAWYWKKDEENKNRTIKVIVKLNVRLLSK